MRYLVQKPLVPLAEISRTLVIPESTLRDWIRKGKIVVESAARSYRKSALNMIDLNSLASEIDRDTEELAMELGDKDVKIFIRTMTKTERDNVSESAQMEAMEPEAVYESTSQIESELHSLFRDIQRLNPDVEKIGDTLNIDSLAGYLEIKPEKLLFELEKERHRRKVFLAKLLKGK